MYVVYVNAAKAYCLMPPLIFLTVLIDLDLSTSFGFQVRMFIVLLMKLHRNFQVLFVLMLVTPIRVGVAVLLS